MISPHKDSAEIDSISRRARLLEATKHITTLEQANAFAAKYLLRIFVAKPYSGVIYRALHFNRLIFTGTNLQDVLVMGIVMTGEKLVTTAFDNLDWFEANHDRKPNPEQSFVPSEQETAYAVAREKIACALTLLNDATALLAESQRLIEGKAP